MSAGEIDQGGVGPDDDAAGLTGVAEHGGAAETAQAPAEEGLFIDIDLATFIEKLRSDKGAFGTFSGDHEHGDSLRVIPNGLRAGCFATITKGLM